MKKIILCLTLLTVCMFSACSMSGQDTSSSNNTNQSAPTSSEELPITSQEDTTKEDISGENTKDNNSLELIGLLDEINSTVQPGTAGSTLKAVPVAVKFFNWGVNTEMTTDEIINTVTDWTASKESDELIEFSEQMSVVDGNYKEFLGENAEGLLDDAGCADTLYPWSGQSIDAIEVVLDTLGLR